MSQMIIQSHTTSQLIIQRHITSTMMSLGVAAETAEPPEVVVLGAVFPKAMVPVIVFPEVVAHAAEQKRWCSLQLLEYWWRPAMHFQLVMSRLKEPAINYSCILMVLL